MAPSADPVSAWDEQELCDLRREGDMRVAVVGAGVSGLTTCKHLLEHGFDVTVFEAKSGVGGVWRSTYPTTKLQTPRPGYQFSDFAWDDHIQLFPSHHQVVDYLESYASRFELFERIHFNSKIISLDQIPRKRESKRKDGKATVDLPLETEELVWNNNDGPTQSNIRTSDKIWKIQVRRRISACNGNSDYLDECLEFDYVVMCCGRFGDIPKLPSFPPLQGPEVFEGQVMHALEYSSLGPQKAHELVAGKKVVIVGFQKTSLDIAVEVAEANQGVDGPPCSMVFRRTHWMYPRHRLAFWYIPFASFWSTRIAGFWMPKPDQGLLQTVLQYFLNPLRRGVWKMIEYYLRFTLPLSRFGLVPQHSLFDDLSACVLPQVPVTLFQHLEANRILLNKSQHLSFFSRGVRLEDGTTIEADSVIFCTGYNGDAKLKCILPEEHRNVLLDSGGTLNLYRGVIHPRIPNMAFIGYFEGLSSVHSSEMGARWLAQLLKRRIALPSLERMEAERSQWLDHAQRNTPFFNRPCVAPWQIWHNDRLCGDLGQNRLRKKSWLQEIFSIYGNNDYKFSAISPPLKNNFACGPAIFSNSIHFGI